MKSVISHRKDGTDDDNTCIEAVWKEFPSYTQAEVRAALAKCGLMTKHIESKVKVLREENRQRLDSVKF